MHYIVPCLHYLKPFINLSLKQTESIISVRQKKHFRGLTAPIADVTANIRYIFSGGLHTFGDKILLSRSGVAYSVLM